MRTTLPRLLRLLALPALLAAPAHTQGASKEDGEELRAALQSILGEAALGESPASVDLRALMPPVGTQTMNDCAAWAFGYYARSYVEARNQKWTPSEPWLVFSPSYIYNQINGGKDEGSQPLRVLELLRDRGAATLSTFPYAANDYLTPPPAKAHREAPAFRIENFALVPSGEEMRSLLGRGEVVVLGVRTNPVFSEGRYDVYDLAAHERGRALRAPGQPHGYHAMAVAGYDDARQAFLVMNSWGSDWGEDGAVWVHYEVAESFNLSESSEHLVDYGLVMFDSRSVIERSAGVWKPLDLSGVRLDLRSRFIGLDEDGERVFHHYFELVGKRMSAADLSTTRWELIVDGNTVRTGRLVNSLARGPNNSFSNAAPRGRIKLSFKTAGGREGEVEQEFAFDTDALRQARLSSHDAYFGARLDDGTHAWRWAMVPRLSARDWTDLESIEWRVEQDDGTLDLRGIYEHDGSTTPDLGPDSKAACSGVDPTPRSGTALMRFKDGTSLVVGFPEKAFESPVLAQPTLVVRNRAEGRFHGQTWHHFDARVVVPVCWRSLADSARFTIAGLRLDGGLSVFAGEPTRWPAPAGFAISRYAAETLDVDVDIQLGLSFEVDNDFVDPNVLFEKEGERYRTVVERSAEEVTLDLGTPDVTFAWTDRYVGLVEGTPTWEVTQFLADRSSHSYGNPTYTWPEGVTHLETLRSPNVFCEVGEVVRTSEPYEVEVRRADYEVQGEPVVLHAAAVSPRSPRTTAVSLDVRRGVPDLLTPAPGRSPIDMATVDVRGPLDRLDQLRALTVYVPSLAGGFQEAHAARRGASRTDRDDLLRAPIPVPVDGASVHARVDFIDGGSALLEATPRGYTPYPLSSPLTLEAIERPWAIEEGLPEWAVEVRLNGHHARVAEVESIDLSSIDERGRRRELTIDPESWTAEVLTSVPLRFEARLKFVESCGRAPEVMRTHATLSTRHTTKPLELFTILVAVDEVEVDPDAWEAQEGTSEPVNHAVTALRGWERELRRVRAVRYHLTDKESMQALDDYEPELHEVEVRDAARVGAFGMPYSFVYGGFAFAAEMTLEGAAEPMTLEDLEVDDRTFFQYEQGARSRIARFGTSETGEPTWILRCDTQRHHYARIANHLEYRVAGAPLLPLAMLDPQAGPWAVTGPNDAGFFSIASQIYPGYPAEAIVTTAPTRGFAKSEAYSSYGWREIPALKHTGVKFEEDRMAKLPEDAGPDELQIAVAPSGPAAAEAINDISLQGPIALSAPAAAARYSVRRGTDTIVLEPFGICGFGHERFRVQLEGPAPDAVKCELLSADGKVLRSVDWKR